MFSFTLVALALMSAALAAPAYAGFHRENPRLTDYQDSENGFSNKPGASQKNIYTRLRSLVVRTSDFSMIKRVLKGISHPGLLFSGYFDRSLGRGSSSILEHKSFSLDGCGRMAHPLRYWEGTRIGISACLRTSGNPGYSRFRITWSFEHSLSL